MSIVRLKRGMEYNKEQDEYEIEKDSELLMHNINTLPANCKKYWRKRYQLFSRFDNGVYMSSELWYSVTPERVAKFTAKLVADLMPEAEHVLDVCCGGGGNTIQFARYFKSVGAIDINPVNVQCTMHNAAIYGVADKIWSYTGDWTKLAGSEASECSSRSWIQHPVKRKLTPFDFVFCSPPWGGPAYSKGTQSFDLYAMEPLPIDFLVSSLTAYADNIGLFLPRTSDLDLLRKVLRAHPKRPNSRVVYVYNDGHCVGIVALIGSRVASPDYDLSSLLHTSS